MNLGKKAPKIQQNKSLVIGQKSPVPNKYIILFYYCVLLYYNSI